jgi:hypothetical protein
MCYTFTIPLKEIIRMDQQPQTQPTPPSVTPPSAPQQPPKKNKTAIITAAVVAVIVIAAIVVGVVLAINNKGDDTPDNNGSNNNSQKNDDNAKKDSDDAKREANAITADSSSDLDAVCDTGSITNAAAFEKPYKIAAFTKSAGRTSWSSATLKYDAPYRADYDEFASVNVVVCLEEDESAQVKTTTCEYKDTALDYYATKYTATAYEAKTGKSIKELGTVNGPATKCPMFASYNKNDPKIIASPDDGALDALLSEFAA